MGARLVACAAAMALLAAPAWATGDCRAWPGEPSPLPTSTDSDGALARWAQLRSLELRALAERAARDSITADRLIRHADCLAPLRDAPPEAPRSRDRLAVRIHRPGLAVVGRGSNVQEAATVADALATLGEPLPIARHQPPPPRMPTVQAPPTNAAGVEVHAPPPEAAGVEVPAPPPEAAEVAVQTPPPEAAGVEVPAPPPEAAEVAVQTPPPEAAAVEVQAPPPEAAAVEVQAPPPEAAAVAVPAPEPSAPEVERPIASVEAAPQSLAPDEAAPEISDVTNSVAAEAPAVMSESAPEPPAVSAAPPMWVLEESWLADAEASLAGARFEETLETAAEARAALASEAGSDSRRTQAELEVLGGAAALALGREEDAAEHFARARSLDPELALDPSRHSPKVIRAFAAPETSP